MNELKPCECGRPAKMQDAKIIDGKATRWFARCESAYCWYGPERDSRERAAESWNRRMSPEANAEAEDWLNDPDVRSVIEDYLSLPPLPIDARERRRQAREIVELIRVYRDKARPAPAAIPEGLREAIEALFESAKEMHECAMRNDVGGWKDLEYDKWRVQAERRYWDATNQARAALRGTGEGNP